MSDIPKNLLDLAAKAVYAEEAGERDGWGVDVDLYHAPLIAAAALKPVLAELRREVRMRRDVHDPRSDEYWAFQEVLKVLGVRDGR